MQKSSVIVLNAVSAISVVLNSLVLLTLISMKYRREWPRQTYNFFALFSCLLGSIVCLDGEKIIMRLFLDVADPSTCYWLAVTTVLLEIIRLWLIAFLSMESYLVLLVDTRSDSELSNTYKIWFRGRRRFKTILQFIAIMSKLHMLGIFVFVGFGGKACNVNSSDGLVRFLSYHWLTVLSTATCAFFCLALFHYIRSILIKSGNADKVKNAYTLTIVPAVALILNVPLVIDRIALKLHFIPGWYFHIFGNLIGLLYSLAIVTQNSKVRVALFGICCYIFKSQSRKRDSILPDSSLRERLTTDDLSDDDITL